MKRSRDATHSWNAATRTGRSSRITTDQPATDQLAPSQECSVLTLGAIKGCAKRGARGAGVAPARLEAERALTRGHEFYPGVARRKQNRVAVFGEEFNGRVVVLFLPRALNDVPARSDGSGALAG